MNMETGMNQRFENLEDIINNMGNNMQSTTPNAPIAKIVAPKSDIDGNKIQI